MVLPGHLAAGYLVTTGLLAIAPHSFSTSETTALLIIGTLLGDIPDIDLGWFYIAKKFLNKTDKSHRHYFTHAPLVWLCISLAIVASGFIADSRFVQFIGWLTLGGSWNHFILDTIEFGIMWLWPFSTRRYTLKQVPEVAFEGIIPGTLPYYYKYVTEIYIKRWSFYLEIILVLIAIAVLL